MTSVFSSIPMPLGGWHARSNPSPSPSTLGLDGCDETKTDDSRPLLQELEEPDLRSLNAALEALTQIFPDIQPEVFRELLSKVSAESRLELVTENLLKHEAKWVRGRYRVTRAAEPAPNPQLSTHLIPTSTQPPQMHLVPVVERFRNESYKRAVKETLYSEFKGMKRSTIRAILAEHNYSYSASRLALLGQVQKSWRFSITSFFTGRKTPSANSHPLVTFEPRLGCEDPVPTLKYTENDELNQELWDAYVAPWNESQLAKRMQTDRALAEEINEEEADRAGEMYDCEVCFTTSPITSISLCGDQGHYVCFRCIRHTVNESIYGQGWSRSVDVERCTLRCIAPMSFSDKECEGCIPVAFLHLALNGDQDGLKTWSKFEERVAGEMLLKSRLPLVQCPFCAYAEVDDITSSLSRKTWKLKNRFALLVLGFFVFISLSAIIPAVLLFVLPLACLTITPSAALHRALQPLRDSLVRVTRSRRGLRFVCQSPHCGQPSCLRCHKSWPANSIHACFESEQQSLRTALEAAATQAVKRTCPRCNLGFVKDRGCNKLVCVCGYTMCYLCREDIVMQGYQHFCQHFRQHGGRCLECEKCDLYKSEDEGQMVEEAKKEAERIWWEKEGAEGLEWVVQSVREESVWDKLQSKTSWERWLDGFVGTFTE